MSKNIFVLYDKETSQLLEIRTRNGNTTRYYYGEGAAKAALTRYCKKSEFNFTDPEYPLYRYGIAEKNHYYENIERQVKRKNYMTGEEFYESVNTPYYCSPSSETYWSA